MLNQEIAWGTRPGLPSRQSPVVRNLCPFVSSYILPFAKKMIEHFPRYPWWHKGWAPPPASLTRVNLKHFLFSQSRDFRCPGWTLRQIRRTDYFNSGRISRFFCIIMLLATGTILNWLETAHSFDVCPLGSLSSFCHYAFYVIRITWRQWIANLSLRLLLI